MKSTAGSPLPKSDGEPLEDGEVHAGVAAQRDAEPRAQRQGGPRARDAQHPARPRPRTSTSRAAPVPEVAAAGQGRGQLQDRIAVPFAREAGDVGVQGELPARVLAPEGEAQGGARAEARGHVGHEHGARVVGPLDGEGEAADLGRRRER